MKWLRNCLLLCTILTCSGSTAQQIFSRNNTLIYAEYLACEAEYDLALEAMQAHIQVNQMDSMLNLYLYCLYQKQDREKLFQTIKTCLSQNDIPEWMLQNIASICIEKDSVSLIFTPKVWPRLDPILQIRASILVQNDTLTHQLLNADTLKKDSIFYRNWDQQIKSLQRKTPAGLVLASIILPGSGKLILGDTYDGFVGFGLSGIYSFLTYRSFQMYGSRAAFTWINLGFALAFYGGNIIGTHKAFIRKKTYRLELLHNEIKANLYSSYFHLPCH